ncbi:MAG: 30S ribosomal protein S8 [Candidatus Magasanikbacteria bacterium CG_4_9_14_3_um_filter_32_9]|uniref:Small ribosomal subunit protein uS8 n=1 Tax=Candidatus Magasanikbacteria bacterium CG_4_9_14_3_um_filter_32_9 TaxID=1974644 RepID=A0A2M7Z7K1_9BACT|nr:MAG: 30S ribosomal protein S8 [Candidatus Magasanikbacteria bacterium CG_4_9_14_3_um_filter_32_9]
MMTDPIADMLTRIRNAQMAKLPRVKMPLSKLKLNIAEILKQEGYVGDIKKVEEGIPKMLILELKYDGKKPAISEIKRESKPGHRMYKKATELPKILNDYGFAIISTSKGLMTNKQARKAGLGGEVICTIY